MKGRTLLSTALLIVLVLVLGVQFASAQEETSPLLDVEIEAAKPGVRITDIPDNGPAWLFGLQEGDIVTFIDQMRVTADTFDDAIQKYGQDNELTFTVLRDGEEVEILLPLDGFSFLRENSIIANWLEEVEETPFYRRLMNLFNSNNAAETSDFSLADVDWSSQNELSHLLESLRNWFNRLSTTKTADFDAKMFGPTP
jgi:hypothetical protein